MKKIYINLFVCLIFLNSVNVSGFQKIISSENISSPVPFSDLETLLENTIAQTFQDLKIPGAIVGVWKGNEKYIKTFGVSDLETGTPIKADDNMRIGSITKTFTGTVVLQLFDEGKLNLSDKLSLYFPDYPNGDNITITMLGNMTSGIYNYSDDEHFVKELINNLNRTFTPDELIDIAKSHPPYFSPGTGFHYSNSNTVLLGMIVEKITGNSLADEIRSRILIPLDMTKTIFSNDTYFPEPHANGYIYLDSLQTSPTDVTIQNPGWGWAAGAIISNLEDVHKYAKKVADGSLISRNAQTDREKWGEVFIPTSGAWKGKDLRYGFALADFEGAIGHNGGIPGFNSFMGYIPDSDITIIILCNMQDNLEGIGPADFLAMKIVETFKNN